MNNYYVVIDELIDSGEKVQKNRIKFLMEDVAGGPTDVHAQVSAQYAGIQHTIKSVTETKDRVWPSNA